LVKIRQQHKVTLVEVFGDFHQKEEY